MLLDFRRLLAKPFCLHTGGLHLLPLAFQLRQHILKVLIALIYQAVRFLEDFLGQPQLPGNGEGVGLSGNADKQPVGRTQCLHVKLTGGVDNTLGAHGVKLQLGIVGSCHHPAAHFPAELNDGRSQSRALSRVGARAQLIEEHQSPVIALRHHIHDGSHMAGEGGKALGNGLLIADIRENGLEGRKGAAVSRGNVQAALGHQGEQTDGFQGDGFAAGVGAGDDHGIKIRAQADGNGNHGFGVNERVTSLAQLHPALLVHDRFPSPHLIAELGFGEDHIQLHQQLIV